jgi:abortive infection alpha-like protein
MSQSNNPVSDVAKLLDSELVKNAGSPLTKEIGEFLGTVANLCRFYMTENLESVFTRWAAVRNGRLPTNQELKRAMPLLPQASMVSDEELQQVWAALLESAATDDSFLPSFGQTLAQLTRKEALYLDRLWKLVLAPEGLIRPRRPGRQPVSYTTLIHVFDPSINSGVTEAEIIVFAERFTDEQKANYERLVEAKLVIEDCNRLGIFNVEQKAAADRFSRSSVNILTEYSFSEYGMSFMRAVTTAPRVAGR